MKRALTLKTQILGSFLILTILILSIIASISLGNISNLGNKSTSRTSSELTEQVQRNMLQSSKEVSNAIQRQAYTAVSAIQVLASIANSLYDPLANIIGTSRGVLDQDAETIDDFETTPSYNVPVSFLSSTFYFPGSSSENLNSQITSSINYTLYKTITMDSYFKETLNNIPEFAWFRIVIEQDKVMRRFPGSLITNDRGYDPTTDQAYTLAKTLGIPIFTTPIKDENVQAWVITIAIPIIDQQGVFRGIVAGDLSLSSIQARVAQIKFLENGYASLILKNAFAPSENGLVVSHPNWDQKSNELIHIEYLESNEDGSFAFTTSFINQITGKDSSVEEFVRDNQKYYLAHAKPIFDVFVLLIIVAESEALSGVYQIENEINSVKEDILLQNLVMIILIVGIILAIGLYFAIYISKPIIELNEIANEVSKNITNKDYIDKVIYEPNEFSEDEIGNLQRSFSELVTSLKNEKNKKQATFDT